MFSRVSPVRARVTAFLHCDQQSTILVKSIWYTLKSCFVFIIAPCSMIKAVLFPKLGPPPHTMLLQGGHFERTDPTLYGGAGGEGGRIVEIVKKGQVYHDF